MSTDLRDRPTPPDASRPDGERAKPAGSGLSLTQVVGGALAAMTAAALGSRLSVAGTIVGAALASVVAAVAGSLYTSSLRHTRDRVTRVWRGRLADGTPADVQTVAGPTPDAALAPARVLPEAVPAVPPAEVAGGAWATPPAAPPRPRLRGRRVLAATLATFALAAIGVTGVELATGQALSGGEGTTISEVGHPQPSSSDPAPTPAASSSATPSESPSATAEPTASPSASSSAEPSATPSASASPSATPSASTSASPSSSPSASTTATPGLGG